MRYNSGTWLAMAPSESDPVMDPAGPLARTLIGLNEPVKGTVEIMGKDIYNLPYNKLRRLRAQMGFVQGYGGLLSNRTIRENITLPLSVHGGYEFKKENQIVDRIIHNFGLEQAQNLRPHDVDGYTRWRSCLARALILNPRLVVLEGIGDWELDRGRGIAWQQICNYRKNSDSLICICMSRRNPEFELWLSKKEGVIAIYSQKDIILNTGSQLQ
jgi:predicted ABC-type transport system involved in lysophospholipase L1 biosynthesis ATPase subunit